MFKNEFQGGPSLDVFSVHGKDPLSKLKVHGPSSAVRKEFDNLLRTFILNLNGDSARSKIAYPKNTKQSLHLTQQFLILQLSLQSGNSFTLEISVITQSNLKLRIIFSSSTREISITAHHVKMPCSVVETDSWINLGLDMKDLVASYFEGNSFSHVDSLVISANCKLKRIFTLKDKPEHSIDIPKNLNFPVNIQFLTQIIDSQTFDEANINIRAGTGGHPLKRTPVKPSTNTSENSHIAFGSRIRSGSRSKLDLEEGTDCSNTARRFSKSGKSKTKQSTDSNGSEPSLTSRGISILPSRPSAKSVRQLDLNNNELEARPPSVQVEKKTPLQPRPPSGKKNKTPNVRRGRIVKSADVRSREIPATNDRPKQQIFSKSADSRNRRRPSIAEPDELPAVLKIKKGISRSAFDLEQTEKDISDNRELHFKSKSLTVLPKIGSTTKRNNRYGRSISISQTENDESDTRDGADDQITRAENDVPNNEDLTDNVFASTTNDEDETNEDETNEDETNEELMALADENEIDDYLKLRTRSSCREDESTYSSCNSANSDLYVYSSRPRSVIRQNRNSLSVSQQKSSTSRSRPASESKSRSSSRNGDESAPRPKFLDQPQKKSSPEAQISPHQNGGHNDTYTISNASNGDHKELEKSFGVDLSWEYSESTSMLVLPQELKNENTSNKILSSKNMNNKKHSYENIPDSGISDIDLERTDKEYVNEEHRSSGNSPELHVTDMNQNYTHEERTSLKNSHSFVSQDEDQLKIEIDQKTDTSSGIISDFSSSDNLNSNGEIQPQISRDSELTRAEKQQKSIIPSSFIMRESCDSDSMSWLNSSQDQTNNSVAMTMDHNNKMLDKSPNMALRQRLKEQLGSLIMQSKDAEDSDNVSECSDDTTYTDMPPKKFRNYRYQDEIQSLNSTLDLSATIPATPRVGEQADPNNNYPGKMDGSQSEELLDLKFDPDLNCYYDPITHKYYELN